MVTESQGTVSFGALQVLAKLPGSDAGNEFSGFAGRLRSGGSVEDQPNCLLIWSPMYIDAPVARFREGESSRELVQFMYDANFNVTGLVAGSGEDSGEVVGCLLKPVAMPMSRAGSLPA